jgi:hypothetical protein
VQYENGEMEHVIAARKQEIEDYHAALSTAKRDVRNFADQKASFF